MTRFKKISLVALLAAQSLIEVFGTNPTSVKNILNTAFEVNRSIDSISLTILLNERINNELIRKKSDFKIIFEPYQVYFIQRYPNAGMEILYNEKILETKALINRNTFAFSSVKLDPSGNMMRKESHHSIYKAGFSYLLNVLEHLSEKYPFDAGEHWQYKGLVKYDGQICHKITFKNPEFKFQEYTIQEGENLEVIAQRDMISDFLIFESNKHISSFDDFTPGKKIKIPSDYAAEIVVYIHEELMIPIGLKTYDTQGLFEHYTYKNVNMKPKFSSRDFKTDNPDYGF